AQPVCHARPDAGLGGSRSHRTDQWSTIGPWVRQRRPSIGLEYGVRQILGLKVGTRRALIHPVAAIRNGGPAGHWQMPIHGGQPRRVDGPCRAGVARETTAMGGFIPRDAGWLARPTFLLHCEQGGGNPFPRPPPPP